MGRNAINVTLAERVRAGGSWRKQQKLTPKPLVVFPITAGNKHTVTSRRELPRVPGGAAKAGSGSREAGVHAKRADPAGEGKAQDLIEPTQADLF